MKYLILLFSFNLFAQVPHGFNQGDPLTASKINENFSHQETKRQENQQSITDLEQKTDYPAFRATSNNGGVINSTYSTYVYEDVEGDTDNAYNNTTGVYTIPAGKSGWYHVSASIKTDIESWSPNNSLLCGIVVNDTSPSKALAHIVVQAAISNSFTRSVSDTIFLNAGDNVRIKTQSSVLTNAESNPRGNFFSIVRVR